MPDGAEEIWFVRQVRRKNHVDSCAALPAIFQDGHERLSFHRVPDGMELAEFLRKYRCAQWSRNGDLVGLVTLKESDFTSIGLEAPSLDNARVPDDDFYFLHHSCPEIVDIADAESLAASASPVAAKFEKGGHQTYFAEFCGDYDPSNPIT